jgi:UDPglucose 6-dehydrogenase
MKQSIILAALLLIFSSYADQTIAIVGTGYVGLVTGACLAEFGNHVICADVDQDKINKLQCGIIPIHESGLKELVDKNVRSERLFFTNNIEQAVQQSDVIFIAIGTPSKPTGEVDLSYIEKAIESIAHAFNTPKIIVIKSTVPVGTCAYIKELLTTHYNLDAHNFAIVSNPEFLREGKAIQDFMNPDRIVIGISDEHIIDQVKKIYEPFIVRQIPIVITDLPSAEMIKYVSNAFLGLKISFINEIANLCDALGINIKPIAYAVGLDKRIGPHFLNPGPGFGGFCLPKDIKALLYTAKKEAVCLHTIQAAYTANELQKLKPIEKLVRLSHNNLEGKVVTILGVAFKADTDDIRDSPALPVIRYLIEHGVQVKVYDPAAMKNVYQLFPDIIYCHSLDEAITNTDALIIMTEWPEFKEIDFQKFKSVTPKIIIDARNLLDRNSIKNANVLYEGIGNNCC